MAEKPSLCLNDYDVYGFDLDHTLAQYYMAASTQLCYNAMIDFLVNVKGYTSDIRLDLADYKEFIFKGLFVDTERGNVVKLSNTGKVLRASHGFHMLNSEELRVSYGDDMTWEHFSDAKAAVETKGAVGKYLFWENYYNAPCFLVYCTLVDRLDRQNGGPLKSYKSVIWPDLLDGIQYNFRVEACIENSGYFYPRIREIPEKIYRLCSEGVKQWLRDIRQTGKCVFLLSASHIEFIKLTATSVLGSDWQSYFDIVVTLAKKPYFFKDNNSFLEKEALKESKPLHWSELQSNSVVANGNLRDLEKFLSKHTGKETPKVVFFGDSFRSDAIPAKSLAGWDVGLVLELMVTEGYQTDTGTNWNTVQAETPFVRKVKVEVDTTDQSFLSSSRWGSFLHHPEGSEKDPGHHRHMNTFWGGLIAKYCDIAIPSIEYIAGLPLDQSFPVFDHCREGNTEGFLPALPDSR